MKTADPNPNPPPLNKNELNTQYVVLSKQKPNVKILTSFVYIAYLHRNWREYNETGYCQIKPDLDLLKR